MEANIGRPLVVVVAVVDLIFELDSRIKCTEYFMSCVGGSCVVVLVVVVVVVVLLQQVESNLKFLV